MSKTGRKILPILVCQLYRTVVWIIFIYLSIKLVWLWTHFDVTAVFVLIGVLMTATALSVVIPLRGRLRNTSDEDRTDFRQLSTRYGIRSLLSFVCACMMVLCIRQYILRFGGTVSAFADGFELLAICVLLAHAFAFAISALVVNTKGFVRSRTGLAMGILGLISPALFIAFLPLMAIPISSPYRPSCQNNLKCMGLVFKMFANESKGQAYPELSREKGALAITNKNECNPDPISPEYLTHLEVLFCPASKDVSKEESEKFKKEDPVQVCLDNSSYMYLGYAVLNDDDVQAFASAYREQIEKALPFSKDLIVPPGTGVQGGNTIYRLREGVERWFITDINNPAATAIAQSKIPTLIERLGHHHKPEGGNVLFLDGHVEFLKYPGPWPMTEKTMGILQSLEAMKGK